MGDITYEDVKKIREYMDRQAVNKESEFVTREQMLDFGFTKEDLDRISENSSKINSWVKMGTWE